MRPTRLGAILTVAALLTGACGSDDEAASTSTPAAPTTSPVADLAGTSWLLRTWAGSEGTNNTSADATLEFAEGGELNGSTGCNRIGGSWEGSDGELTITIGPMTLAGCLDPVAADQESAVVAGLEAATAYEGGDDTLRIIDGSGAELLTYSAVTQELTGTAWEATGINNGAGGVESNAHTSLVGIEFLDDGSALGNAGCNNYSATWTTDDVAVSVTDITATEMSCGPDVDALEQQYIAALTATTTYAVSGSTLELRDDGGALLVAYTRSN